FNHAPMQPLPPPPNTPLSSRAGGPTEVPPFALRTPAPTSGGPSESPAGRHGGADGPTDGHPGAGIEDESDHAGMLAGAREGKRQTPRIPAPGRTDPRGHGAGRSPASAETAGKHATPGLHARDVRVSSSANKARAGGQRVRKRDRGPAAVASS